MVFKAFRFHLATHSRAGPRQGQIWPEQVYPRSEVVRIQTAASVQDPVAGGLLGAGGPQKPQSDLPGARACLGRALEDISRVQVCELRLHRACGSTRGQKYLKGGVRSDRLFFGGAEESGVTPIKPPSGGVGRKESPDFRRRRMSIWPPIRL